MGLAHAYVQCALLFLVCSIYAHAPAPGAGGCCGAPVDTCTSTIDLHGQDGRGVFCVAIAAVVLVSIYTCLLPIYVVLTT